MYKAKLTFKEVEKFFADFCELESSKGTKVVIKPDESSEKFCVSLEPEGASVELLEASFGDGLLHNYGWHEKFIKV